MFSKFNFSPSDGFFSGILNKHFTNGSRLYANHEKEVHNCLSKYITEDGVLNGTLLKEHWFSISHKDVFISHSHCDINEVKAFAGWLYDCFGLEAFIDSCSWGYCNDLLQIIDKKYCYHPTTNTYDYDLRNYTTSHVHIMLSTALTEMIYNTECIIFFNTPHSISLAEELGKIEKKSKKETTLSPWIYHELSMTTMLRKKDPDRRENIIEHYYTRDSRDKPIVQYDIAKARAEMPDLTDDHLKQWAERWEKRPIKVKEEALDELYKIVFPRC